MKRTLRIFTWLLVSMVLILTALELVLHTVNLTTQHRAKSLLTAIRPLRLGESTLTDTQQIRTEFRARKNPDAYIGSTAEQSYTIVVSNDLLNRIGFKYPRLWRFGVKPSGIGVNLRYKNEKLTYLDYSFATPVTQPSAQPTHLIAVARIEEEDSRYGARPNYYVSYSMRPSSIMGTTYEYRYAASIVPRATDEERNAAFNFDLSCLSSLRGCQALCQVMPSAWTELVRRSAKGEISLPEEWLENPGCSRHLRTD